MDKSIFDSQKNFPRQEDETHVQSEIYGDCVLCESSGDFDLPDYLPEIRKLIRVSSKIIPAGRFVGGERADFGGSVTHTVVYTDPSGALSATTLDSDYEISVQIPKNEGESISASADSAIDSVFCRLLGPRKLSIRTKIRNRIRMTCELTIPHEPDVSEGLVLETLRGQDRAMRRLAAQSGEFSLTDVCHIDAPSPEKVKIIFSNAEIHIESATAIPNGISCRGSLWCRALISEGATPYPVTRKIPFEELIPCGGALEDFRCSAYGICTSLHVTPIASAVGGCDLAFDATSEIFASVAANVGFSSVSDAFSTNKNARIVKSHLSAGELCSCAMGNFSISGGCAREGDLENVSSVIDTDGRIKSSKVTAERGRIIVTGECSVSLILTTPPSNADAASGYASLEYDLPFRCELDAHAQIPPDADFDCHVDFLGAKSRIDSDAFSTDAEISITITAYKAKEISFASAVEEETGAADRARDGSICVYYPNDSDSLWSVAKKYGVSRTSIAKTNALPPSSLESSDLPQSIDGLSCLIIE